MIEEKVRRVVALWEATRSKVASSFNEYTDEMDAGFIATHVVTYGKSSGWSAPSTPESLKAAQTVEHLLAPFNIGLVDHVNGTWGHKSGGTSVYRHATLTASTRVADTGPASRLKNVEPPIKAAEREIEKSKSILHGLVREMEMVAKHTHDKQIQGNFHIVQEFAHRLDEIDHDMDKFIADLEHALKSFR